MYDRRRIMQYFCRQKSIFCWNRALQKNSVLSLTCEGALPRFHFTLRAFRSPFSPFCRQACRGNYPVLQTQKRTFAVSVLCPSSQGAILFKNQIRVLFFCLELIIYSISLFYEKRKRFILLLRINFSRNIRQAPLSPLRDCKFP